MPDTTIKTPYDEYAAFSEFETSFRREGYLRGVADTEARYKPLVEAAGALERRMTGRIAEGDSAQPFSDLRHAFAAIKEAHDASA